VLRLYVIITFQALLDRIVILDSPVKAHSLFNVEQSHAFGLRYINIYIMFLCLDKTNLDYEINNKQYICRFKKADISNMMSVLLILPFIKRQIILFWL